MGLFSGISKAIGGLVGSITGGDILSAGASLAGGLMTNSQSAKNVKMSNEAAIELANTAHQREVADLKAAGLNPILSAGGNGASTPTMQVPAVENVLKDTGNSARASKLLQEQLDNIKADTAMKISQGYTQDNLGALYRSQYNNQEVNNLLLKAQVPEALANASVYEGDKGKILKAVEKVAGATGAVAGAANSAKSLARLPSGQNPGMSLPTKGKF